MKVKTYVGNTILVAWAIFCIWGGVIVVSTYGEIIQNNGGNFPLFIIIWLLILFAGRFGLEWLINKMWRE